MTERRLGKRERILDAARSLFLRNGLRGTSMEAIAREAGIAKPTLYAHFADKDAVFTAILEVLIADKMAAFEEALAGEGEVAERIGAALARKYQVLAAVLEASPHADELFSEHRRAARLFEESDAAVLGRMTAELSAAGVEDAENLARLLVDASFGVAQKAIARTTLDHDIRLLAERLIGPEVERG
jgi:AcrR family transcriptional regulator